MNCWQQNQRIFIDLIIAVDSMFANIKMPRIGGKLCQNLLCTKHLITFDLPLRFQWYLVQIDPGCVLYRWKPGAFCSRIAEKRLPAIYVVKIAFKCRCCHFGGFCISHDFAHKCIITERSNPQITVLRVCSFNLAFDKYWCISKLSSMQ